MKQDQFSKWNATKVKARADYTCQKCGSMENIQAHDPTMKHTDWLLGVALCGDCHSEKHPDMPPGLFTITGHQPYWPNVSARQLAKKFHCHNRTIIRWAKRLGIPLGQPLNDKDKERLHLVAGKGTKVPQPKCAPNEIAERRCQRCGHIWWPRRLKQPTICPKCKSALWQVPRKEAK